MKQISPYTGEVCSYEEFRSEVRKPRRTQKAQRQEIEKAIDTLTAQGDFWSLDLVRNVLTRLTGDGIDAQNISFALLSTVTAEPGEWVSFTMRKADKEATA